MEVLTQEVLYDTIRIILWKKKAVGILLASNIEKLLLDAKFR